MSSPGLTLTAGKKYPVDRIGKSEIVAKQYNEISTDIREHIARCLYRNGASRDDAEDAIQSALLAYHRRTNPTVIDNVEGWLLRVSFDDWKDICRVKKRWVMLSEWREGGADTAEWENPIVDRIVLSEILVALSAIEREILDYEARGLSREEMALSLRITEEAVKKRLYRARYKARKLCARFLSD